ncbi:hypothetical protein [Nocardioides sp. YIM 152315]|uniref:hypothetical protein n=1 Tax=Nocardioides sp. YIM 152315 TaxID=3031760 RepID=UPI0023DBBDCB|nr:hypothetical protein [Nocardioides sp. YIM 152315]MDF1603056.1 hypothetical protein [Nocardioides sp. YIM 152315]
MSQQRAAAATAAVWLTAALIALSVVTALFSIVFKADLLDAWESGRADAGSVEPPDLVPVVVVMLIVLALLMVVLVEFFRSRHAWARTAITVTVVALALGTLATLRIGPPALFVALSVISLVLDAAVLVALWHRDTGAYLRAADRSGDVRSGS